MSSIDYPTTADRAHTIALETLSDSGVAAVFNGTEISALLHALNPTPQQARDILEEWAANDSESYVIERGTTREFYCIPEQHVATVSL